MDFFKKIIFYNAVKNNNLSCFSKADRLTFVYIWVWIIIFKPCYNIVQIHFKKELHIISKYVNFGKLNVARYIINREQRRSQMGILWNAGGTKIESDSSSYTKGANTVEKFNRCLKKCLLQYGLGECCTTYS